MAELYVFGLDEDPGSHGPAFCGAAAHLWELLGWQPRETIRRMAEVCGVETAPWSAVLEQVAGWTAAVRTPRP